MDKPEQWASDLVEQVIPAWWKDSDGVDGAWDSPAAAAIIQRAFEERERALRERIRRLEIEVNGPTPADIGIDPDGPTENAMFAGIAALKDKP